jgi:hypothetical protein
LSPFASNFACSIFGVRFVIVMTPANKTSSTTS